MKLGEIGNCAEHHNMRSCVFPLEKMAEHIDRVGSTNAKKKFEEYLKSRPNDIQIKWLLNVVNMTLGTYPKGVSKSNLIRIPKQAIFSSSAELAGSSMRPPA